MGFYICHVDEFVQVLKKIQNLVNFFHFLILTVPGIPTLSIIYKALYAAAKTAVFGKSAVNPAEDLFCAKLRFMQGFCHEVLDFAVF